MTTPNAELAYLVLDHIDAHPELWRQDRWMREQSCGTAYCFAGWTVALSGGQIIQQSAYACDVIVDSGLGDLNGKHVSDAAEALLGVSLCTDDRINDDLFSEYNTREDLGRLVAEIFGPRPAATA